MKPPPRLTVSEWADDYRRLSAEASSEPGTWTTARAEYQRGIMDAISDPSITEVVVMSSAQVGKTEMLLNCLGFHIAQDPAPLLLLQPTLEMAQAFSKDRLAPMLRDTPALRGTVKDARARDSGNTMLHKSFPGGHITMAGANSPASLASRPIRVVLADEADRYPASAGTEGDPITLARKRTANFWNRKIVMVSTPGTAGSSRIERAYNESDQRVFLVACSDCGHEQRLVWKNVVWPKGERDRAEYVCEQCGTLWSDSQRWRSIARGRWEARGATRGVAGFHLSALYSPWTRLSEIAREHEAAMDDTELLKAWTNTTLGETWQESDERVEATPLYRRREHYDRPPASVQVVTWGCDVQADRFEFEFVGWGEGEESWSLDYQRFYVDPTKPQAWINLAQQLRRTFETEDGRRLTPICGCIDSGYLSDEVYAFSIRAGVRWAIPVKGSSQRGKPIHTFPRRPTQKRVYLTELGTDTGKDTIYQRLAIEEPGPGYCHWPIAEDYDEEYFAQLAGEVKRRKFSRGHSYFEWHATRPRVEALDCRVYAFAALRIALQHLGAKLNEPERAPSPERATPRPRPQRKSNWVGRRGQPWIRR